MKRTARIAATFNRSSAARDQAVAAVAMPAVSSGSKGSGAPARRSDRSEISGGHVSEGSKAAAFVPSRRLRATLAVLALALALAAFTLTAAPANASTAEMGAISDVSYTSANVTGKVSTTGFLTNEYFFEYCTTECSEPAAVWKIGYAGAFFGAETNKDVGGTLSVPKGGTKYFVRLTMLPLLGDTQSVSPEPNPSFTTLAVDPPTIPGPVEASKRSSPPRLLAPAKSNAPPPIPTQPSMSPLPLRIRHRR